jgi:hypothetical protein
LTSDERWSTSVNDLASIFRDALSALVPIAERARMPWREPNNYDDWDAITEALFKSLVINSLEHANEWNAFSELPRYDLVIEKYAQKSFLTVSPNPGGLAFVRFETELSPFDTAVFARLNVSGEVMGTERLPIDEIRFVLAGRSANSITVVDRVNLRL